MKEFLRCRKAEARAYFVLVLFLVLAVCGPRIYYSNSPVNVNVTVVKTQTNQQSLENNSSVNSNNAGHNQIREDPKLMENSSRETGDNGRSPYLSPEAHSHSSARNKVIHPCQSFDPNTISQDSLVAWGIYARTAFNLVQYRNSGGVFRKTEDIRKIYGMTDEQFRLIESCILLENRKRHIHTIDINTADSSEWSTLPGIGPVFSSRIIKFRNGLGGFYCVDQVAETFGLPPETFNRIKPFIEYSTPQRKINIHTISAETLATHPYFTARQATAIKNYTDIHGGLHVPEDLLKMHFADSTWVRKVGPYLIFDEN